MMPVLTTPRETRSFDFVPVNIIRDDGKETSFRDRNFGDFSDVSLVPAGTNSRIQVRINLNINFSFKINNLYLNEHKNLQIIIMNTNKKYYC